MADPILIQCHVHVEDDDGQMVRVAQPEQVSGGRRMVVESRFCDPDTGVVLRQKYVADAQALEQALERASEADYLLAMDMREALQRDQERRTTRL
jgi:hypothetical protein